MSGMYDCEIIDYSYINIVEVRFYVSSPTKHVSTRILKKIKKTSQNNSPTC